MAPKLYIVETCQGISTADSYLSSPIIFSLLQVMSHVGSLCPNSLPQLDEYKELIVGTTAFPVERHLTSTSPHAHSYSPYFLTCTGHMDFQTELVFPGAQLWRSPKPMLLTFPLSSPSNQAHGLLSTPLHKDTEKWIMKFIKWTISKRGTT